MVLLVLCKDALFTWKNYVLKDIAFLIISESAVALSM